MKKLIARIALRLARYRMVGETPPSDEVCVLVAAPHTSNWDFILMISMAWLSDISPTWLGKQEMFRWPFGVMFRAMGGIPVDRSRPTGLVATLAERAATGKTFAVVIPPEGTRRKKEYWQSGFYRLALEADIPVVLTYLDGPTRTGGFGPTMHLTGNVTADMDQIREYYRDKHGVRPAWFTPPRLRSEDHVPI